MCNSLLSSLFAFFNTRIPSYLNHFALAVPSFKEASTSPLLTNNSHILLHDIVCMCQGLYDVQIQVPLLSIMITYD